MGMPKPKCTPKHVTVYYKNILVFIDIQCQWSLEGWNEMKSVEINLDIHFNLSVTKKNPRISVLNLYNKHYTDHVVWNNSNKTLFQPSDDTAVLHILLQIFNNTALFIATASFSSMTLFGQRLLLVSYPRSVDNNTNYIFLSLQQRV